MCDPTAIAIGSLVIGGISNALKAKSQVDQQNAQAADAAKSAMESAEGANRLLDQQAAQQTSATTQTIFEADRESRSTTALAQVSAGAAGVSGISVEALMGDIDNRLGQFKNTEDRNLNMALNQLTQEKANNITVAKGRIASDPPTSLNPLAVALPFVEGGLSFWAGQIRGAPPTAPSSNGSIPAAPNFAGITAPVLQLDANGH